MLRKEKHRELQCSVKGRKGRWFSFFVLLPLLLSSSSSSF